MNFRKHFAATFAAAGMLLGAASASAVSFTVVIDKIEVMENGTSPDRITIYHPAAGIGEATTRTLDLLNANKAGTALPVRAPNAGTYRTMLVTFGDIWVGAESATVSAVSQTVTFGTTDGFGTEFGRQVLVMGDVDPAAGIGLALGGVDPVVPMQPIVSTGGSITLPAFNFFLRAADVVVNNNNIGVTRLPVPISVARNDVDSNLVPNVTVGVKGLAFGGGSSMLPANVGNFNVKVGLFRSALDLKPVYMRTATIVSNSLTTAASITEVTFVDVADGTYLPLAWYDANNNNLLDSGEATIMADVAGTDLSSSAALLTIDKAALFGTGAAGVVSSTSAAFDVSDTGSPLGTLFGGATANGYLGESGSFYAFPAREISITVAFSEVGSVTLHNGTDTCAAASRCGLGIEWAGADRASNDTQASLSIVVGSVITPSITVELDDQDLGIAVADLEAGDTASLVFVNNTANLTTIANNALLSYSQVDADNSVLKISPVPLTNIKNLNINAAGGYGDFVVGMRIQAQDNTGAAVGALDVNAMAITEADIELDGDASGRFNGTTLVGEVVHANKITVTNNLGN